MNTRYAEITREAHIEALFRDWRQDTPDFPPILAGLPEEDMQTFEEAFERALAIGNAHEQLAKREFLALFRMIDSQCERVSNDRFGQRRSQGKRIMIDGVSYLTPDFEVSNGRHDCFLIDIKSKQYHSYYHIASEIQQYVDQRDLDEYLIVGRAKERCVFILFHLWPAVWMKHFGKGPTARIHAGDPREERFYLPDDRRQALIKAFPVDDHYYLIPGRTIKHHAEMHGGIRRMKGKPGYFFPLALAVAGPGKGLLPPLDAWRSLADATEEEGANHE